MDKNILDYFQNLPPIAQFILGLITILGTSGFFTGIFGYLIARNSAKAAKDAIAAKTRLEKESGEQKARIEALEIRQIREQSAAQQAAADRLNTQKLIEVIASSNDRWQKVIDTKSERQFEGERLIASALEKLDTKLDKLDNTLNLNSRVVEEFSHGVSLQLGNVAGDIKELRKDSEETNKVVRTSFKATNRTVDNTFEAVVAIRDSVIQMINDVKIKVDSLSAPNCDEFKRMLEIMETKILARLTPPEPVANNLPAPRSTSVEALLDDTPIVSPDTTPQIEATTNQP